MDILAGYSSQWRRRENDKKVKVKVKASHTRYTERWARSQPVGMIVSHPPGSRLPLLSARALVTFPDAEHHGPLAGTKLYNNLPKVVTQRCPE